MQQLKNVFFACKYCKKISHSDDKYLNIFPNSFAANIAVMTHYMFVIVVKKLTVF